MTRPTEEKGERRRRRRLPDDDPSHGQSRHSKKSQKRANSILLVWTVTFAAVALVAIGLFLVFWLKPYIERRDLAAAPKNSGSYLPVDDRGTKTLGEADSIDLTKRALKSREVTDVDNTIAPGSSSLTDVIGFLAGTKERDGDIIRYDWMPRLDTARTDMVGVLVTFKKEGKERNRIALISPDENKVWKMDFQAFARTATPSWPELLEGSAKSAIVRVYVAPDQYYNSLFQEDKGWRCYGLASPDVQDLLFGYCDFDSPQGRALTEISQTGRKMSRATVEIEHVEGAEKRQYLIKRVLAEDWALGPVEFDAPKK